MGCRRLTVYNRKINLNSIRNQGGKIFFYLTVLLSFLQVLCITAIFILYKLSRKNAGVNHHVVFKKYFYLKNILSQNLRYVYAVLIAIMVTAVILYCIKSIKKPALKLLVPNSTLILLLLLLEVELLVPQIQDIAIYVYVVLCTLLISFFQLVKILLFKFYYRKNRCRIRR